MSALPVSAICAYDATELGPATDELVCLHPFTCPDAGPFRLYADDPPAFAVSGELDLAGEALFGTTLRRTLPLSATQGPIVIDGRGLEFVDHRGLRHLDRHLTRVGTTAVLWTESDLLRRVAGILELSSLRVTGPGE
ncbi:hypothetical protein JT362_15095 [Actinophytocola sp. S1-96]|uniref:STAS domain-containing protein n=1 Tax=Actinophytocola gossypii TaxID=2812003 RepID=A0ABT2J9B0_9PSEU|nr:hypothetical protein [Actinophytocola gossypii]